MCNKKIEEENLPTCDPSSHAQIYIGTKQVKAFPMCIKDAESYLNRNLPSLKEEYSGKGYIVIYEDGFKSWSPKEVFDKAYRPSQTFLDRLIIERDELSVKTDKLASFVDDTERERMSGDVENLLEIQLDAMKHYYNALNKRLSKVSSNTAPYYVINCDCGS